MHLTSAGTGRPVAATLASRDQLGCGVSGIEAPSLLLVRFVEQRQNRADGQPVLSQRCVNVTAVKLADEAQRLTSPRMGPFETGPGQRHPTHP
jgi:hypothetical protein